MTKRLTISDNLQATEKEVFVTVNANGTPTTDTFVNSDFGNQVRTVFVGKAESTVNPLTYPTSAPFVCWNATEKGIQIMNIRGLPVNSQFKLRLIMFG